MRNTVINGTKQYFLAFFEKVSCFLRIGYVVVWDNATRCNVTLQVHFVSNLKSKEEGDGDVQ